MSAFVEGGGRSGRRRCAESARGGAIIIRQPLPTRLHLPYLRIRPSFFLPLPGFRLVLMAQTLSDFILLSLTANAIARFTPTLQHSVAAHTLFLFVYVSARVCSAARLLVPPLLATGNGEPDSTLGVCGLPVAGGGRAAACAGAGASWSARRSAYGRVPTSLSPYSYSHINNIEISSLTHSA
jgi:hypothetical protein